MAIDLERTTLQAMLSQQFRIEPDGEGRYVVATPFTYGDGDSLNVVLKHEGDAWVLSDEGETLMHLSFRLDLATLAQADSPRTQLFTAILTSHGMANDGGELRRALAPDMDYGVATTLFIEGLIKITDLVYLALETSA